MLPRTIIALSLGATLASIPLVSTADFTVGYGETVGAQSLSDGETGIVQMGGAITTIADGDIAIDGSGANNTKAINRGTITTSGTLADGIYIEDGSTAANAGSITTSGNDAYGMAAWDGNIVTNSGIITTNGIASDGLNGHDDNRLTNSGTITTNGPDSYALAGRYDNTIENSGAITTNGVDSYGIYVWDDNSITNSGSITTTGDFGAGIFAEGFSNDITNSGAITTNGVFAYGIFALDGNNISNSGSINTSGSYALGIYAYGNSSVVSNSGSINTGGDEAYGIWAYGDDNIVSNSGRISTGGDDAYGIHIYGNNNIVSNSGGINTSGINAYGIMSEGNGNIITNSGRIISAQSFALISAGFDNTVNLLGGTVIQGGIMLVSSAERFNYGNGLNTALTFTDNIPGSINTNGMPSATSGMLVATVDTTGFAMEDEVVADITDCGHDGVGLRLDRTRSVSGGNTWGSMCGNIRRQQDSGPAVQANHLLGGVVFGSDHALASGRRLGWMVGFSSSRVGVEYDAQEVDVKSVFGGIYGSRSTNGSFVDMSLLVGYADHNSDRHVVNNLVSGGLQTAQADYNGYFVSPGIRIGTTAQWWGHKVQPSLDIRYAGMRLDGYSESGSAADVTADDRTLHTLSARAKLSFFSDFQVEGGRTMQQESYVGLVGRSSLGDDDASIELLGSKIEFDYGGEDRSLGLIAGLNATLLGSDGAERVSAGFNGELDMDGNVDLSVHVNAVIPF